MHSRKIFPGVHVPEGTLASSVGRAQTHGCDSDSEDAGGSMSHSVRPWRATSSSLTSPASRRRLLEVHWRNSAPYFNRWPLAPFFASNMMCSCMCLHACVAASLPLRAHQAFPWVIPAACHAFFLFFLAFQMNIAILALCEYLTALVAAMRPRTTPWTATWP